MSSALDLETDFGDATVEGVRATSYRLASGGSGDLTLDGCSGSLDLRTISGKIEVLSK